jgi:superfamily II DNA helicase RecQ
MTMTSPSTASPAIILVRHEIIKDMLATVWKLQNPHQFQVEAIEILVFTSTNGVAPSLCLVRKTGEGKSIVLYGMATMRRNITLCIIPLVGLGSDQARKVNQMGAGTVHAIHADETKGLSLNAIETMLMGFEKDSCKRGSLIIYMSPQSLAEGSRWRNILEHLAKNQLISGIAFDEAHCVPQQGKTFRKEFAQLKHNCIGLVEKHQPGIAALLSMSATFPMRLQCQFKKMLGIEFTATNWGPMDRRSIDISVNIVGRTTKCILEILELYVEDDQTKVMIFCATQVRAEGTMLDQVRSYLGNTENLAGGHALAFTGSTGVMEKSFIMALFDGSLQCDICDLRVLPVTSAATYGISSSKCRCVISEGPPRKMEDVVQQMGRAARNARNGEGLPDRYALVMTMDLFVSLYVHIIEMAVKEEKQNEIDALLAVLRWITLPTKCYHVALESEFQEEGSDLKPPCVSACPFCRNEHLDFTGEIKRDKLTRILRKFFNNRSAVEPKHLHKSLSENANKQEIWKIAKSNVKSGMVQCLVLQLIASNIIKIDMDCKISLAMHETDQDNFLLALEDVSYWKLLNTV